MNQKRKIPIDDETMQAAADTAKSISEDISPGEIIRKAIGSFLLAPLTISETAKIAKVSERTVRNWLRKGLGHCKAGRIVLISRVDLYLWFIRKKPSSQSGR